MTDERRRHPGFDPSDPPPRKSRTLGVTVPPLPPPKSPPITIPDSQVQTVDRSPWTHWSPTAIAGAFVVIITALGGAKGLQELLGSAEETQRRIDASKQEILAELRAEKEERQLRQTQLERQIELTADLAAQLNRGPAGPNWPHNSVHWKAPPLDGTREPEHITYVRWDGPPRR